MRLIDTQAEALVNFPETTLPPYAILSHTWGSEKDELTLQDLQELLNASTPGRRLTEGQHDCGKFETRDGLLKIRGCAEYARRAQIQHIWIDTCCIDKTSSAELSEAINSMYRWYQESTICYVYLADVTITAQFTPGQYPDELLMQVRASRWFTRGWTLQELIAPKEVYFFDKVWRYIGQKTVAGLLRTLLSEITGIDEYVLAGLATVDDISIAAKMKWASARNTTRVEDMAYCLLGLFNVNMPLLYGEGDRAFIRLQEEIIKVTNDQSIFAWKFTNSQQKRALTGLLAPSPKCFRATGWARPLPALTSWELATPTSKGLRVRLKLLEKGPWGVIAVLECYPIHGEAVDNLGLEESLLPKRDEILDKDKSSRKQSRHSFAIFLQKLGDDQYARSKADQIALVPPQLGEATEGQGYATVYIKQNPEYIPPDILLQVSESQDLYGHEVVVDSAYPPSRFSPESNSFRSIPQQIGRVMGAFRFKIASPADQWGTRKRRVMDLLFSLEPRADGRWRCHLYETSSNLEETSLGHLYNLANSLHMEPGDPFRDLSARQRPSHSIWVVPRVSMEVTYGRTFAMLHIEHPRELHAVHVDRLHTLDRLGGLCYDLPQQSLNTWLVRHLALLTEKFTIPDSLNLSIFPSQGWRSVLARPKIRTNGTSKSTSSSCMMELSELLGSIELSDLRVFETDGGKFLDGSDHEENIKSIVLSSRFGVKGYVRFGTSQRALESVVVCNKTNTNRVDWINLPNIALRPVFWAALQGQHGLVETLIREHKVDIDLSGPNGLSLMHFVTLCNPSSLAKMLEILQVSENTHWLSEKTFNFGDTAAHFAAAYLDLPWLIRALLPRGEDGKRALIRNIGGETALHRGAAMGNYKSVKAILELIHPEHVDVKDADGRTALWHAAASWSVEQEMLIRLLIQYGARINETDALGRTPLAAACIEGNHGAVARLLQYGADARRRTDNLGVSPLQLAALFGHHQCLQALLWGIDGLLQQEQSNFDKGNFPVAAIHLAASNGWTECVKILKQHPKCQVSVPSDYLVLLDKSSQFSAVRVLPYRLNSASEAAAVCEERIVQANLER